MRLGTNTSAGTVPGFKDNSFFKHVNTYGYNKKSLLRVCALFLQSTMTNGDSSQHRQPCPHIHSQCLRPLMDGEHTKSTREALNYKLHLKPTGYEGLRQLKDNTPTRHPRAHLLFF